MKRIEEKAENPICDNCGKRVHMLMLRGRAYVCKRCYNLKSRLNPFYQFCKKMGFKKKEMKI